MHKKRRKRPSPRTSNSTVGSALTLSGLLVASSVAGAVPAGAQSVGVESRGRSQQADRKQRFDIPAGPLDAGLRAFEAMTALTLRLDAPLAGVQTKGAQGELTSRQALAQLLDGTGLTFIFTGETVVMVRPKGPAVLDAVRVMADQSPRASSPKYTAPLLDVPKSVTVIPREVIEAQAATSLREVLRNVPGITINAGEGGTFPGDNFNVRGFSATNDIFVDGVRDVSGYSREAFNLEQVEVTKGPNSAMSGRGSTGGSINIVTKQPSLREMRSAGLVLGSADQRRGTGDINQPIPVRGIPGVAFRMSAMKNDAGVAGLDAVENNSWGVAPSLAIGLATPTQLTLSYMRTGQHNLPSYGLETFNEVPKVDTRHFFGLRSLDFEKVDANVTTARLDHSFGEHAQLRNQFTRGHSAVSRIVTPANPTTGVRSPKTHMVDNEVLSNQTNLTSTFETGSVEHALVTGVEVSRENSVRGSFTVVNRPLPVIADLNNPSADENYQSDITPVITRTVRAKSLAAYAFETMKLGSAVELNGGLRWESYKPEYTDSASKAAAATSGFAPATARNLSGSVGLVVKPKRNGSVYASYGTSFNPSTENLSNDAISANSSLPPEKSVSYEIGTKWDLFKQRLQTAFALFRTEKTNARTSDPANPGLGTILSGKQRVEGGEVSVAGRITHRLNLLGGYSYLESEYVESLNPAQVGTSFANVPKHSVNAWTTYEVTEKLEVGGGGRYVDRRFLRITGTNEVWVPSYHSYDAMASYKMNTTLGLQLNVYNLTDKLYYDSGRMWVPAAGRAVSVTTSVTF